MSRTRLSPGELRNYILKHAGRKTPAVMCRETGYTVGTIRVYAFQMKVSLLDASKKEKRESVDHALRKYAGKKTMNELIKMLGTTYFMLTYRARRLNIDLSNGGDASKKIHSIKNGVEMFEPSTYNNWLIY